MANIWTAEPEINGFGLTVESTAMLLSKQTAFQKIDVYETRTLGRMLTLDGIIQLTEFDEFAYHEMMAHLPLFAHPDPRRVLVIGGGDGGVLREIARHACVEVMDICEIDQGVIDAAREFLPFVACGFDDPRVSVHIADGSLFVKDKAGYYDVIIVDSTDPGGPGAPLFGEAFYRDMKTALRPGGIIATQAESPYILPDVVADLYRVSRAVFRSVGYASILVPTYPSGNIGALLAGDVADVTKPARGDEGMDLQYYNTDLHSAAFRNPEFVRKLFSKK